MGLLLKRELKTKQIPGWICNELLPNSELICNFQNEENSNSCFYCGHVKNHQIPRIIELWECDLCGQKDNNNRLCQNKECKNTKPNSEITEQHYQRAYEEKEIIAGNAKYCPHCGVFTEKARDKNGNFVACNNLLCTNPICGKSWCWKCLYKGTGNNDHDDVYNHLTAVHGGIYN